MGTDLPDKLRKLKDKDWLNLLYRSVSDSQIEGIEFPGFPPEEVQTNFVGSANKQSLYEAYNFYVLFKDYAARLKSPLKRSSRFLDFGCGWGRFLRFFWKDVDAENLYGCDVDRGIVEACRALHVPGQIDLIEPLGSLPYPDNFFDSIMAYSVFTHLPEKVHMHWLGELARVAKPGCIFCLTLEPRRFLDFVAGISPDTDSNWGKALLLQQSRLQESYKAFDAGEFVYLPTNAGMEDHYGDAVIPRGFIEKNWPAFFQPHDYIDDSRRFWQAVLVAQAR